MADYNIVVDSTFDLTLVNNTATHFDISSDYATSGNVNFQPTVLSGNRVDADIEARYSMNITATNNVGAPACARRAPALLARSLTRALVFRRTSGGH